MTRRAEKRTVIILLIGLLGVMGASILSQSLNFIAPSFQFSMHMILEIISISIAMAIAIQAWMVFPHTLSRQRLLWGALFLSVGVFDIMHVLSYEGMPFFGELSSQDENAYWLISRLTLAIGALLIFSLSEKQIQKKSRIYILAITIFYVVTNIMVVKRFNVGSLFNGRLEPTFIKNSFELLIILFLIGTIMLLLKLYRKTKNDFYLVLFLAFGFSLYCEFVLVLNLTDSIFQNMLSHVFKITSFYFFMKGIYATMIDEPFLKHKEAQVALQESEIRLEEVVKKVNYIAFHDELTGLPNRNYLLNSLEENMKQLEKTKGMFALVSINLNRFKNVNDTLGNEMGDLFLKTIATRLREFKDNHSVLARMVADEFMFVMPNRNDINELIRLANTIHKRIEEPMIAKGFKFHITSSIGITLYHEKIEDIGQIIKQAQLAMHEAKKNGQSVMVYHPDMNKELFENILLENDLRQALDRHELILHYQPQVNIETGEIIGVEALIRWHHREKGMISPGRFIPLAEETGLIIPIGNWVIEEACKQLKKWHKQGIGPLRLSVNISLRQIFQEDLVEIIGKALKKSGIKPEYLELEITESMAVNSDRVISILQSLKKLGVRISVDDFGTGYSSLSYLYSFPIDQLKIDQSFISNLFIDENNKVIVSTIISMGQNLGLELIAEGVETSEQFDFLRAYKCVGVQGYLISRPLPPEEIEGFLLKKTIVLENYTG